MIAFEFCFRCISFTWLFRQVCPHRALLTGMLPVRTVMSNRCQPKSLQRFVHGWDDLIISFWVVGETNFVSFCEGHLSEERKFNPYHLKTSHCKKT